MKKISKSINVLGSRENLPVFQERQKERGVRVLGKILILAVFDYANDLHSYAAAGLEVPPERA